MVGSLCGCEREDPAGEGREQGGSNQAVSKAQDRDLEGKKLPEQFRAKAVTFSELADDAIEWAKGHKLTWRDDEMRLKPLREVFGARPADSITPQDVERWFFQMEFAQQGQEAQRKEMEPRNFQPIQGVDLDGVSARCKESAGRNQPRS